MTMLLTRSVKLVPLWLISMPLKPPTSVRSRMTILSSPRMVMTDCVFVAAVMVTVPGPSAAASQIGFSVGALDLLELEVAGVVAGHQQDRRAGRRPVDGELDRLERRIAASAVVVVTVR